MKPIAEIAAKLGLTAEQLCFCGNDKAKIQPDERKESDDDKENGDPDGSRPGQKAEL